MRRRCLAWSPAVRLTKTGRYGAVVSTYTLVMPDGFEDDAWLFVTKGWLPGVTIFVGDVRYEPEFYDAVRFAQTLVDDVNVNGFAVPENVVVVREITLMQVQRAVERLAAAGFVALRPVSGRRGVSERPTSGHAAASDQERDGPHMAMTGPSAEAAEVMKRATIHFDGGGLSPGPVTAACTVELSDGSSTRPSSGLTRGLTTPPSGRR